MSKGRHPVHIPRRKDNETDESIPIPAIDYENVVILNEHLGPPELVVCPRCHEVTHGDIRREVGCKTHMCAGCFCLLGLFCLAWVPYVMKRFKEANRYCTHCGAFIDTLVIVNH